MTKIIDTNDHNLFPIVGKDEIGDFYISLNNLKTYITLHGITVVKCLDCKNCIKVRQSDDSITYFCDHWKRCVEVDGYCNYGQNAKETI